MKESEAPPTGTILYRAPYVVPVTSPVIDDGGVLVGGSGQIVAVDRFKRLRQDAAQVVELDGRIITPALINCHAHLELSHLADLGRETRLPPGNITAWIRTLLARRAEDVAHDEVIRAGAEALAALSRRGVAMVCDIGNHAASLEIGAGGATECLFFQEILGVTAQAAQAVLATLTLDACCTAHAPYSCHPSLLIALKQRAQQKGSLFPIHVAESADEVEFLTSGAGPFQQFLDERLRLVGALATGQVVRDLVSIPGCGSILYLHRLNILDRQTICVHAVHISESEADLLAKTGAKVCLCPGSNRRLGVGVAKVSLLTERQILPGLGTDSLTSNTCLDLWYEMQVLQQDHPGLSPQLIFRMATRGGAETLGVTQRLGGLAPGLAAKMLAIGFNGPAADIYPFLVDSGQTIAVDWLEADSVR